MSVVGQPLTRLEGRLKVTGGAQYTADASLAGVLHGSIVHSPIANGRTISIDTTAAERAPGVLAVFTYRNMPASSPYRSRGFTCIHTAKAIWCCKTIKFTMLDSLWHW